MSTPLEQYALLSVLNTAAVRRGQSVAVIGCGGVWLSAVNGAALAGASRIIALDTLPHACCLVPERRAELTTEGGLDVVGQFLHRHAVANGQSRRLDQFTRFRRDRLYADQPMAAFLDNQLDEAACVEVGERTRHVVQGQGAAVSIPSWWASASL